MRKLLFDAAHCMDFSVTKDKSVKVLLFFVTLLQSVQLFKCFLLFEFQCSQYLEPRAQCSDVLHRESFILLLHNHLSTFFSPIQNIRVTINNTALKIWKQIHRRLLLEQYCPAVISKKYSYRRVFISRQRLLMAD